MPNEDCIDCKKKRCSTACFNAHAGSIIALKKVLEQEAKKKKINILLVG